MAVLRCRERDVGGDGEASRGVSEGWAVELWNEDEDCDGDEGEFAVGWFITET